MHFSNSSIASFTGSLLELVALARGYALCIKSVVTLMSLTLENVQKALIGTSTIMYYGSNGVMGLPTDTGLVWC